MLAQKFDDDYDNQIFNTVFTRATSPPVAIRCQKGGTQTEGV
jgi:hypothetical protein